MAQGVSRTAETPIYTPTRPRTHLTAEETNELLDEFLGLEVSAQVENLPRGEAEQTKHREDWEIEHSRVSRFCSNTHIQKKINSTTPLIRHVEEKRMGRTGTKGKKEEEKRFCTDCCKAAYPLCSLRDGKWLFKAVRSQQERTWAMAVPKLPMTISDDHWPINLLYFT